MTDYRDLTRAYLFLARVIKRQNEYNPAGVRPLLPIMGLIEVIHTETYERRGMTSLQIWARAVRGDGREDILEYDEKSYHAVRDEPGHVESMVRWRNLDDAGYPIEWVYFYSARPLSMGCMVRPYEQARVQQRRQKLKYLYYAITPGVRACVVDETIQVNKAQYHEATHLLVRLLMGLDEQDDLWKKMPKPVEEISARFPGPEHS